MRFGAVRNDRVIDSTKTMAESNEKIDFLNPKMIH